MTTTVVPPEFTTSDRFVYHSTNSENIPSITANGIQSARGPNADSKLILDVLSNLEGTKDIPFNRHEVVYCHTDADFIQTSTEELEDSKLSTDSAYAVIDITAIDAPMYLADMSIITDLIDYTFGGPMERGTTPEDVLSKYINSIERVETIDAITEYQNTVSGLPELVIDGDVPPKAITPLSNS